MYPVCHGGGVMVCVWLTVGTKKLSCYVCVCGMMVGLHVWCVCNEACKITNQDKMYLSLFKASRVV